MILYPRHFALALMLLLFSALTLPAAPATPLDQCLSRITLIHLGNGLRLLFSPDSTQSQTVVTVFHTLGTALDTPQNMGITYLAGELTGAPTRNLPEMERFRLLRQNGGEQTTRVTHDGFYIQVEAPPYMTEEVLWMEGQRLTSITFPPDMVVQTQQSLLQRLDAALQSPIFQAQVRQIAQVLDTGPYRTPPFGTRQTLSHLPLISLQDHVRKLTRPSQTLILITGRIEDMASIRASVEKRLGPSSYPDLPDTVLPQPHLDTAIPSQYRFENWVRPTIPFPFCLWSFQAPPLLSRDLAGFQVLKAFLEEQLLLAARQLMGRFHEPVHMDILENQNLFASCLTLRVTTQTPQALQTARARIRDIMELARTTRINATDLKRFRDRVRTELYAQMADPHTRAILLAQHLSAFGNLRLLSSQERRLSRINSSDILSLSRQYLDRTRWTILNGYPR